jgi:Spy/CpxP family protein refolding chaperone
MIPRSRLGAVTLLVAAMSVGALVGGIAVSVAEHRGTGPASHNHGRDGYVARLTDQLSLTAAQQDSVRAVLDRHRPEMDSMWQEVRPRFDSVRTIMRGEIRAQLSPEQQQKYQQLIERREREQRERKNAENNR